MLDIARKALLLLGLVYGSHALAAEPTESPVAAGKANSHVLALADRGVIAPTLADSLALPGARHDWQDGSLQLEFRDSSALGKIRRIRGLSLLTLAETRRSKLFLGMNKRGLFGLHFSSHQPASADRVLEVARLPYLNREATVAALTP